MQNCWMTRIPSQEGLCAASATDVDVVNWTGTEVAGNIPQGHGEAGHDGEHEPGVDAHSVESGGK